jgi:hypothetical protein
VAAVAAVNEGKIPYLTPMNGISAFGRLFSCKKSKKIICKSLKNFFAKENYFEYS